MTDDLRERVARAMCDAVNVTGTWEETGTLHREKVWFTSADAAIALIRAEVLEEAAKAIDEMPLSYPGNAAETALECADAIRALKERQ